jgi:flagellar biosynthesis protein FliR
MTLWGYDLWAVTLAFSRIGTLVMLMPGIGEAAVPARARLGFALLLSIMLAPQVAPAPDDVWGASGQVISELAVGFVLGGVARILMTGLATAGQIFGLETGLSFAQTADPLSGTTGGQAGQIISVFLGLLGTVLVFATNLHHVFIRGIVESYVAFAPGKGFSVGDASDFALEAFSDAFRIGLQIAAPVVVAGFVFRIGLGVLARLAPSIQVFFVAMPLNILGGFIVLTLGLSSGMLVWLDRLQHYASSGWR